jgi:hypothetical protein
MLESVSQTQYIGCNFHETSTCFEAFKMADSLIASFTLSRFLKLSYLATDFRSLIFMSNVTRCKNIILIYFLSFEIVSGIHVSDLLKFFRPVSHSGVLSKDGFLNAISELIPREKNCNESSH